MPSALPFVYATGKVRPLFEKIASAKIPDAFSQKYLAETLGLTASGDRPLIPLLRALGFIDSAGRPTPEYAALKNPQRSGLAIAEATKRAYGPLFSANENAHLLTGNELKGLVAQVAGTDDDITTRTAGTFRALVGLADSRGFTANNASTPLNTEDSSQPRLEEPHVNSTIPSSNERENSNRVTPVNTSMRPEFHYNIQVHLPASGTEETYLNIFNAMRKALS